MKLFVIGDSISLHYGPFLGDALADGFEYSRYAGDSAETAGDLDHPAGPNAGDSRRVLGIMRHLTEAGDFDADLLLLNCGLHDIKTDPVRGTRQVDNREYRENLERIVQLAGQLPCELIWMRTTPCDEKIHNTRMKAFFRYAKDCETINQIADEVMRVAGIKTIDLHGFTLGLGKNLFCDHVHFRESVRRLQAAFIAEWVEAWRRNGQT